MAFPTLIRQFLLQLTNQIISLLNEPPVSEQSYCYDPLWSLPAIISFYVNILLSPKDSTDPFFYVYFNLWIISLIYIYLFSKELQRSWSKVITWLMFSFRWGFGVLGFCTPGLIWKVFACSCVSLSHTFSSNWSSCSIYIVRLG